MRFSRGCLGNSRSASTHMLTAVKCAGSTSFQARVSGRRSIGSSPTTIGSSRTLESATAIAASIRLAPAPSAEIRITCAGPAHIRIVEASAHHTEKPKSCANAPIPI